MKKIIRTLIVSFLVLVTVMTTACAKKEEDEGYVFPWEYEGTHIYTAPEVEDERYILRNGEFLYTVVVPENPNAREIIAKDEFLSLLKRATGVVANVVVDKDITTYNPNGKYVSIGQTTVLEEALDREDIVIDRGSLKTNGARILTIDDNIFLTGGVADGAINAVYDFFNICFEYEWYGRNNLYINDTLKNVKLRDFDVTDIPDINTHQVTYGPLGANSENPTSIDTKALSSTYTDGDSIYYDINIKSVRCRYGKSEYRSMFPARGKKVLGGKTSTSGSQHNVLNIFSKFEEGWESKWWADSQNQLCWNAHGDAASYERMIQFGVNKVISYMKEFPPSRWPDMNRMMFGNEDGGQMCTCAACKYSEQRDGGGVGASIRFVRQVHDRLREWLDDPANAEYYREEFKIVIFAYGDHSLAPTHKNSKGEWVENEGMYEGMEEYRGRLFDDLIIWKAFGGSGAGHVDITSEHEEIQTIIEDFNAWACIFDEVFAWNYGELYLNKAYFQDFLSRFNTTLLKFYGSMNMGHMITELCSTGDAVTRWGDLYFYVITKLSWDSSLSTTELITKFMKAQFGPAAETMEKLYYAQKTNLQKVSHDLYVKSGGDLYNTNKNSWTAEDYPYPILKNFISSIDQAYVDIETLKYTDPDMYDVYKDRIDVEGVWLYYAVMQIHSGNEKPYSPEEKAKYKSRAVEILKKRNIPNLKLDTFLAW